jgi:hypothetical protein
VDHQFPSLNAKPLLGDYPLLLKTKPVPVADDQPDMPAMAFEKRDNMGYAIHPSLIVLLILLAAAALVTCGYAVNRLVGIEESPNGFKARTVEQDDYMREVRSRNVDGLMSEGKRAIKERLSPR